MYFFRQNDIMTKEDRCVFLRQNDIMTNEDRSVFLDRMT